MPLLQGCHGPHVIHGALGTMMLRPHSDVARLFTYEDVRALPSFAHDSSSEHLYISAVAQCKN